MERNPCHNDLRERIARALAEENDDRWHGTGRGSGLDWKGRAEYLERADLILELVALDVENIYEPPIEYQDATLYLLRGVR